MLPEIQKKKKKKDINFEGKCINLQMISSLK